MTNLQKIKELERTVRTVVIALVDQPNEVQIRTSSSKKKESKTVIFTIDVAKEDIGKVVGKRGKNISALRSIMSAVGAKFQKRIIVEVNDNSRY